MSPQIFIFFLASRGQRGATVSEDSHHLSVRGPWLQRQKAVKKKNFLLEGQCVSVIDMSLNAVSGVSIFFLNSFATLR